MAIAGLVLIVVVMVAAIRILRQPKYRYLGNPEPRERRSFRETMLVWMMGRK